MSMAECHDVMMMTTVSTHGHLVTTKRSGGGGCDKDDDKDVQVMLMVRQQRRMMMGMSIAGCHDAMMMMTVSTLSCTKYVWYHGHRDHISCIPKTEELFQEHFYWLKAPGVEEEEDCGCHPTHRLLRI